MEPDNQLCGSPTLPATREVVEQYAPKGVLRVALNHGNRVLVGRNDRGEPFGISVDLAKTLADYLGLELRFVEFERAVDVSSSAEDDVWDVCFLAVDPKRAQTIDFADPYVRIEGCYLASAASKAKDAGHLVASGAKVGSIEGTAYSLTLLRKPGAENLIIYRDIFAALDALDAGEVEAVAGIRQAMEGEAARRPGGRVLQPPFMEIRQAMAVPRGRPSVSAHLRSSWPIAPAPASWATSLSDTESKGRARSCRKSKVGLVKMIPIEISAAAALSAAPAQRRS